MVRIINVRSHFVLGVGIVFKFRNINIYTKIKKTNKNETTNKNRSKQQYIKTGTKTLSKDC